MAEKYNITKFYCYAHRTADTNHVFYIGKGHGNRAYSIRQRSKYWHNKANKHGHIVEIISSNLTERQAFDMEREYIAFYGRDKLVNLTDGGEGASGYVFTKEDRKKLSISNSGRFVSEETRKKLSESQIGKPRKKSSIEKMIVTKSLPSSKAKMQGKNNPMHSEVAKIKLSNIFKGKKQPKISGSNHYLSKQVICIELNIVFETVTNAQDWLVYNGNKKASTSAICKCCKGKYKIAYGYTWKYADK